MIPITRIEKYLAKLGGNDVETPVPITRIEKYLDIICGNSGNAPMPVTRIEKYLAKIAGMNVSVPTPSLRVEIYLSAIAGDEVDVPEPITRIEYFLYDWLMASPSEVVTVTGETPLTLVDAVAKSIKSLVQYGKCTTVDGEIYCNNGKLVAVDDELPSGYKRLIGITFDGNIRYETGEALTGNDDVTMTVDNIASSGKNLFGSYNGANDKNFSMYIYGSSSSGSYFRYGDQLKRPKFGSGQRTITFGKNGTSGFADDADVTPDEFVTPANTYIGMLPNSSSAAFSGDIIGSILVSNRLEWIPCENPVGVIGYYEKYNGNFISPTGSGTPVSLGYDSSHLSVLTIVGTPEILTVETQTSSVANLFSTGTVHDEHDIISGTVVHRTEVVVSNGTVTIQALAEPVTEHIAAQRLQTIEGDNVVSATSEVGSVELKVEYMAEG